MPRATSLPGKTRLGLVRVLATVAAAAALGPGGQGCARRRPDASPVAARVDPGTAVAAPGSSLRPAGSFASITDRAARSRALFQEASRVLTHPRCINCHPDGDTPHQGMEQRVHDPPVVRGPADKGVVGVQCASCHQDHNLALARVPGAPDWHLAPRRMAWVGKSVRAICLQLKDPERNGKRTLAEIVEHSAHDKLVAWGWSPGHDREPAPGSQEQFGRLVAAWVETGAECPAEGATP